MTDAALEQFKRDVEQRFQKGASRMDTIEDLIDENRKAHADNATAIAENTALTKDIKEMFDAVKGVFKVLGWIGVAVKWIGIMATGIASVWALVYAATHGGKPL